MHISNTFNSADSTQALQAFMHELPPGLRALLARDTSAAVADAARLPRRSFLKIGAASGFALGLFGQGALAQNAAPSAGLKPFEQPAAFVQIAKDGTVTVTVNRLEFGQGINTALPMVLAEELDADWSRVQSVLGNASPAYVDPMIGVHLTGGSGSVAHSFTQYRELGARARAMLVAAAAKQWGVDPASLRTERGQVLGAGGQRAGYGDLADAAMQLAVPPKVALKDPKDFRIIGKPVPRLDARAKTSGQQKFGIDVRLPGMLTALLAHPPVFGARLQSVNDAAARAVPGVKAVLRVPTDRGGEGVAVIADGWWAAKQGRDALVLAWDNSGVEKVDSATQLESYRALAKTRGRLKFDADMAPLAQAPLKISAEFTFPYLAHAPMEPLNCTIAMSGNSAELWVGSQIPGFDTMAAAKALGLEPQNVKLNVQMAGGGFGRRAVTTNDYIIEACSIAKAANKAGLSVPLQVLWSREDDIRGGYYRPAQLHRAEIGFDAKGRVLAWDHTIVGQSITAGTPFAGFTIKDGIDNTGIEGMKEPYDVPMRLNVHHPAANVPVLWWRSVGATHTAYVMETLIDEIARATRQDPVAYRMQLMGDKRSATAPPCNWRWKNPVTASASCPKARLGAWRCMSHLTPWWRMWWRHRLPRVFPGCMRQLPVCIATWPSTP